LAEKTTPSSNVRNRSDLTFIVPDLIKLINLIIIKFAVI
jgi:hypothetical protein